MIMVEVRRKGQRTRGETLQARQRRIEAEVAAATAAAVTKAEQPRNVMWANAEAALFERRLRPEPIVAQQPTFRIVHDTRVSRQSSRGASGKRYK